LGGVIEKEAVYSQISSLLFKGIVILVNKMDAVDAV